MTNKISTTTYKLKENRIVIIMISVIILLLFFILYWFIYRPYAIKKACINQTAKEWQQEKNKKGEYFNWSTNEFNELYNLCLKLKKL